MADGELVALDRCLSECLATVPLASDQAGLAMELDDERAALNREKLTLAAQVITWDDVEGVKVIGKDRSLLVETHAPDRFYSRLPELSLSDGTAIEEVYSDDDNLEAVFKYLVNK